MFVTVQETSMVSPEKTVGVTVTPLTVRSGGTFVMTEATDFVLFCVNGPSNTTCGPELLGPVRICCSCAGESWLIWALLRSVTATPNFSAAARASRSSAEAAQARIGSAMWRVEVEPVLHDDHALVTARVEFAS